MALIKFFCVIALMFFIVFLTAIVSRKVFYNKKRKKMVDMRDIHPKIFFPYMFFGFGMVVLFSGCFIMFLDSVFLFTNWLMSH